MICWVRIGILLLTAAWLLQMPVASAQAQLPSSLPAQNTSSAQPLLEVEMSPEEPIGYISLANFAERMEPVLAPPPPMAPAFNGDMPLASNAQIAFNYHLGAINIATEVDGHWYIRDVRGAGEDSEGDVDLRNGVSFILGPIHPGQRNTLGLESLQHSSRGTRVYLPAPDDHDLLEIYEIPDDGVLTIAHLEDRLSFSRGQDLFIGFEPQATITSRDAGTLVRVSSHPPERRGTGGILKRRSRRLGTRAPRLSHRAIFDYTLLDAGASHLFRDKPKLLPWMGRLNHYDQRQTQACAAFATCLALDYEFARQYPFVWRAKAETGRFLTNPQYVYYWTGISERLGCLDGRTLEGVSLWLQHSGVETYYSLGITDFDQTMVCRLPPEVDPLNSDAPFFKPLDAELFDMGREGVDVAGLKWLLKDKRGIWGRPIVLIMPIDADFLLTRTSSGSRADPWRFKGPNLGNHIVTLVGYEDPHSGYPGAFLLRNSWGDDWKQGGYCWVDYSMFSGDAPTELGLEAFVIKKLSKRTSDVTRHFSY